MSNGSDPPSVTPARAPFEDFDLRAMSGAAKINWINDQLATRGIRSVELFHKTMTDGKHLIGRVWKMDV